MPIRETTDLAVGAGASVTYDDAALGLGVQHYDHTVLIGEAPDVGPFDIEVRIAGRWRVVETAVANTDFVVLDQVGFDAVRVTNTGAAAGTVYFVAHTPTDRGNR